MASCLKTKDSPLKQNLEKLEGGRWPDRAKPLENTIEMDRSGHSSWDGQDRFNCETTTYSSSRGMMQPEGMDPKGRDRDRDMSKQQGLKHESFATRRPGRLSKTKNMEFGVDHQEATEELQPSMNYDGLFSNNKKLEDHIDSNFIINSEDKNLNPRLSSSSSSRPKPTFEYEILVECYDSHQVNRLQAAILKTSKILDESVIQPPKKLNKMQENHHVKRHASYPKKSPSRPILLYKLVLKCSDPTQIKTIYGALLESSIVLTSCVYSSKGNEGVPFSRMKNIAEPAVEMINIPTHRGSSSSVNHTRCGPPSLTPIEDQRDHLQTHLSWPCKEVAPIGIGSHGWNEMRKLSGVVGQRENNGSVSLPSENINDMFKVDSENCLNLGGIGEDAISTWCDHVDESMNKLASCGKKRQLSRQLFDELSMLESLFSQCEEVSQAQCKERRIKFPECLQVPTKAKAKDNLEQTQPHDDQSLKEDKNHHQEAMAPKMMSPYIQTPSCNPEYFVALEDPYCRPSTSFQPVNDTPKVQTTAIDVPRVVDSEAQSDDVIVIPNDAVAMGNVTTMLSSASKPDINNQIADIFSCDDDARHHEDFPTFASSEIIGQQIANIIANAPTNIDAMGETHDLCGPSVCLLPSAMANQSNYNVDNQNSSTQDDFKVLKESSSIAQQPSEVGVQTSTPPEDETFLGWLARTTGIDMTSNASQTSPRDPKEEYSWWPRMGVSVETKTDESESKTVDDDDDVEQQQQQEHVDTSQNEAQSGWWINPFTSLQATVVDQFRFEPVETVSSKSEQRKSILNSFYEEILTQSQGSPPQTESKKSFTMKTLSESGNLDPEGTPSFTTEPRGDSDLQTERNMSVTTHNQLENNPQIEREYSETNEHLEIIPLPTKPNHPHVVRNMSLPIVENPPNDERRMSLPIEENPYIVNMMSQPMVENPPNAERKMSLTTVENPPNVEKMMFLSTGESPQTERRMSLTTLENPPNAEERMSLSTVVPTKEDPPTEKMISLITSQSPHDVERNIPLPTGVENPQVARMSILPIEENPHVERSIVQKPQSNPQPTEEIRIVSETITQNQIFENENYHIARKSSSTTKVKPETSEKALETNLDWNPYILGTSPPQLRREFGSHKINMDTIGGMKRESVTKDVQTIGRVGSNISTSNQVSDSSNLGITTSLHN